MQAGQTQGMQGVRGVHNVTAADKAGNVGEVINLRRVRTFASFLFAFSPSPVQLAEGPGRRYFSRTLALAVFPLQH